MERYKTYYSEEDDSYTLTTEAYSEVKLVAGEDCQILRTFEAETWEEAKDTHEVVIKEHRKEF